MGRLAFVCSSCGAPRQDSSALCPNCGAPLESQSAELFEAEPPQPIIPSWQSAPPAVSAIPAPRFATTADQLPSQPFADLPVAPQGASSPSQGMSGPQSLSGQQQGKASSRRKAANVRGKPPKARSRRRAKPPEMPAPAFAAIDLDTPAPPPAPNYQPPSPAPPPPMPPPAPNYQPPSPAPRQLADATEQPEPSKQVAATASGDAVPEAATVQAVGSQTPTLMFDNGDKLAVGGEAVLGRAPTPNERQLAVVVNDPTRTVSKTHLSFGLRNGQLWVADLGSTNGTRVFAHDGSAADLVPHQPRIVLPDETVQFGERYFTVVT